MEVCCGSLAGAIAAAAAGADRIELNSALPLGGLTPSAGLVREVLSAVELPVIAMTRPRAGGFCYSAAEWSTLLEEADWLAEAGVRGLAFGALTAGREIDAVRCREIVRRFGALDLVFHRAFDLTCDGTAAIGVLVDCGVQRVMTSGQAATAAAGVANIRAWLEVAANRIGILPAGGITSQNAAALIARTGCRSVHGTFSRPAADPGYPPPGGLRFAPNDDLRECDPAEVADLIRSLREVAG